MSSAIVLIVTVLMREKSLEILMFASWNGLEPSGASEQLWFEVLAQARRTFEAANVEAVAREIW